MPRKVRAALFVVVLAALFYLIVAHGGSLPNDTFVSRPPW